MSGRSLCGQRHLPTLTGCPPPGRPGKPHLSERLAAPLPRPAGWSPSSAAHPRLPCPAARAASVPVSVTWSRAGGGAEPEPGLCVPSRGSRPPTSAGTSPAERALVSGPCAERHPSQRPSLGWPHVQPISRCLITASLRSENEAGREEGRTRKLSQMGKASRRAGLGSGRRRESNNAGELRRGGLRPPALH